MMGEGRDVLSMRGVPSDFHDTSLANQAVFLLLAETNCENPGGSMGQHSPLV